MGPDLGINFVSFMRYNPDDAADCEQAARFLEEDAQQPGNCNDPDRMRRQAAGLRERAAVIRAGGTPN